jgi:hypothetical protein
VNDADVEVEASDPLARFLDRKYRQVWARHRITGEWVFLDRGQATDEMRVYAKAELKCPVRECDVKITARGRSKRDHFVHMTSSGHGEGEGEWHLQAKALLAEWAQTQPGFTGQEEETVSIKDTGRVRRADVMATHSAGAKVAFEVEYNEYTPEKWRAKQADYDSVNVTCTWVFGHLNRYLRQTRKPTGWPENQTWDRLQWVELTDAVARAGRPVLFINPVERAIVTAIQTQKSLDEVGADADWWEYAEHVGTRLAHPDGRSDVVLVLDPIDTCTLDPVRGLLTPTMVRVEAERALVEKRALEAKTRSEELAALRQKAREAAEAEQRRHAAQTPEEKDTARAYAERLRQRDAEQWKAHPLRARVTKRLGAVPDFLNQELRSDRGIYAHPAHWHCQLFEDLVLGPPAKAMLGQTVTFNEVCGMVHRAGFRFHREARRGFAAIRDFLDHLEDQGYLDIRSRSGDFIEAVVVVADLDHPPRRAVPNRWFPRNAPIAVHDHTRWDTSSARARLLSVYPQLPAVLALTDPEEQTTVIRVTPVHWHTHLYLQLIHNQVGQTFTIADAVGSLTRAGLSGHGPEAQDAVDVFLDRMREHGHLALTPAGRLVDFTYTVIDDRL